ncbi:hypothetical protein L228DRAFT_271510 [Xylona heveae TC161]|uniref:F-box domain-containing protein n=1 Tax=Xylona heveae (strain CBS 132557 / TC161) TaxID=1328760 RepID=A0A164ZM56_XYLHT|nr:hypothetical protein L228DRAFT_271510 [Xylona heveae TC161]KZF19267.1 hypothetical protein L228DRAFT_271510 [Xylona heveae TC161]
MAPATLLPGSAAREFDDPMDIDENPISRKSSSKRYKARKDIYLPPELVIHILSFIPLKPSSQTTLWSCCLVSRTWYTAAVPLLYDSPHITGRNFTRFITTVCPSINAHVRKSELADLVRRLDMGELVHNGSKSLTARLLGRVKVRLEEFVAPQASFAINCFAALSKCTKMKHLDLSLISQSISLHDLFHALKPLTDLETLWFPRCANHDRGYDSITSTWPPSLKTLHLTGGVSNHFLQYLTNMPPSLSRLTIKHCRTVGATNILAMLEVLGPQLTHLHIDHNIPCLWYQSLDRLLLLCPKLILLRVPLDFISGMFVDPINAPPESPHPLQTLELDSSGDSGVETNMVPDDLFLAVDEGPLRNLRRVLVGTRVAWKRVEGFRRDLTDLVVLLEERAEERAKARKEAQERKKAEEMVDMFAFSADQYGQYDRYGQPSQPSQYGRYGHYSHHRQPGRYTQYDRYRPQNQNSSIYRPHRRSVTALDRRLRKPSEEKKAGDTASKKKEKEEEEEDPKKAGIWTVHLEFFGIDEDIEEKVAEML